MITLILAILLFIISFGNHKAGEALLIAGEPVAKDFQQVAEVTYFGGVLAAMIWVTLTLYEIASRVAL